MKLTLAVGLQYDNRGFTAAFQSDASEQDCPVAAIRETAIDLIAEPASAALPFATQDLLYLTYNLQGLTEPMPPASEIDLFI